MQGDGTEWGKDGGEQGNFLDVFGVEIHPTFHVFLFFFSANESQTHCGSPSLASLEGGFGRGERVAHSRAQLEMSKEPPNGPGSLPAAHRFAQAPKMQRLQRKESSQEENKAQRATVMIKNVNNKRIPFPCKVLPESLHELGRALQQRCVSGQQRGRCIWA